MKQLCCVLLMLLFVGTAYSANGAALQITGYKTIPDTIYPGTTGQLQLTILNSGTDPASSAGIDYSTPSQAGSSRMNIGDIGAGSSAVASIPFTVPQSTGSGFFVINVNVVYLGDATHGIVKNTPATIPVVVAQHQILAITTVSVEPQVIQPGDKVGAQLEIANTGGVMNNVVISTSDTSTFTLEGASQQTVGNIPSDGNVTVAVLLSSSSSTPTGKYSIPLTISYQDSLQNTLNQTVFVGPVTVTASSAQFRIYVAPLTPTEIGSEAQFALTLENLAGSGASPIVDISGTDEFTPIGATRIFFDDIEPGMNQTKIITVGIVTDAAAGYYTLPLEITSNGMAYEQDIGIDVSATPDVIVTTETQPAYVSGGSSVKVLAQISNNGNSQIRSVYASVASQKTFTTVGTTDKFIGTMNVDDFATFQFTINVPPNTSPGEHSIPIAISFKDKKNIEHTLQKNAVITVYSGQDAGRLSVQSGETTSTGSTTRDRGGLFGLGLAPLLAGAVVLAGVGYFGYKRWKGSKK